MWDLARFCAVSGLRFEPAVTHRFTLDEAPAALAAADGAAGGKVVFEAPAAPPAPRRGSRPDGWPRGPRRRDPCAGRGR
jgi:hypothetical protein